ncbi:MAG: hypothetical protein QOJ21_2382 [Solirubrobacteraceae bacterium]|nr:hypothetical protein [Solirubrobacteraceae bacterium]
MPRLLSVVLLTIGAAAALAASARAQVVYPKVAPLKGPVSGDVVIVWQQRSANVVSEGEIRYHALGRLRSRAEQAAWVPGEIPTWAERERVYFSHFVRANASVARYTRTVQSICEDGQTATLTSVATGRMLQPNALLALDEPEVDIAAARGHVDVDLPFAVHREDGVFRVGQAVFATGAAEILETGTTCGFDEARGVSGVVPAPDTTQRVSLHELMGASHTAGVIDGFARFPGRFGPAGLQLAVDQAIPNSSSQTDAAESMTGRIRIDLRLSGAPLGHGSVCAVPDRLLRRTRTLAAAQRLLRRHGFRRSPFGGARRSSAPRGSFFLDWSSSTAPCGKPVGSHAHPALFRSTGLGR